MRGFIVSVMAVAGMMLASAAARATDWAEVRTKHFTIYGRKSDRDLPKLATRLELLNTLLARVLKMPEDLGEDERPLIVYVVPQSEVKENSGSDKYAGFYATDKRNGYAVVRSGKASDTFDMGQEPILFHEFTHHFMQARSNAAYPAWFVEGFAEFFSTLKFEDDQKVTFGNPPMYRVPQLVMSSLYPIHKLLHETSAGLSLEEGDRYYGEAWLLTHYCLLNTDRGQELQAYLKDLSSPGGAKDVASYFKGGESGLAKDLNLYVHSRLKAYRIDLSADGVPPPQVRLLRPDENAMLIQELRFKRPMGSDDAKALAKDVQATAAQFPDSAYAQGFLAEVMMDLGDWPTALAAADAAIRIDPANSRAHAARAETLWGQAKTATGPMNFKAILSEISAANRSDLSDPYPLFLYYRAKREQGPLPDVALAGLQKAYYQLPQHGLYRWSYAEAMAAKKDYASAINAITPLANDPHGNRGAEMAQKKLNELIALRDGKPLPVTEDKPAAGDVAAAKADPPTGKVK